MPEYTTGDISTRRKIPPFCCRVLAYGRVNMFMDFLGYGNHVELYSEEISRGGEGLGNTPQAFSHVTLISAAFNLDRAIGGSFRSVAEV